VSINIQFQLKPFEGFTHATIMNTAKSSPIAAFSKCVCF